MSVEGTTGLRQSTPRTTPRLGGSSPLAPLAAECQSSSTIALLAFYAGLRDSNCGHYRPAARHPRSGMDLVASEALKQQHEDVFAAWLQLSREAQESELRRYCSELDHGIAACVAAWRRSESYRSLAPASASVPERSRFFAGLESLLDQLACQAGIPTAQGERHPSAGRFLAKDLPRRSPRALDGITSRNGPLLPCHDTIPGPSARLPRHRSGPDVLDAIHARSPKADSAAARFAPNGPSGCLSTEGETLTQLPVPAACPISCAWRLAVVRPSLTPREKEVMRQISLGKVNKEIGALLFTSESTVRQHRKQLCRKLGIHSTAELVVCAVRLSLGLCPSISHDTAR